MAMELTDLAIFVAVVEEGATTRAAERLGMTQPGVSQHIAKLEAEIGCTLFERRGKRLALSDFGSQFLGGARKLLKDAASLRAMSGSSATPTGTIRLGLTDASTQTVIPPALLEFRGRYPGVHIRLDVDDSGDIEDGVLRGHYDFGVITEGLKPHPQLEIVVLYRDRIDALVSRSHPLSHRKHVGLKELAKCPLLVYPRRSRTRVIIDEAFHSAGVMPRETIDVYINTAAVKLAEVGVGVALLSQAFIEEELPKGQCVQIRVSGDPFARSICLVRRADAHISEAAGCFCDILTKGRSVPAGSAHG